MKGLRRRAFVVLGAMAATAGLANLAKPTRHLADRLGRPDLESLFPKEFGEWRLDTDMPVILPAPDVQAKLSAIYNQVLSRTYVNLSGQRIMLSVAYGGDQSDGTRAHRPEVCYPVQGFEITFSRRTTLQLGGTSLPVRILMSRMGARHEPITYWLVVGGEAVTSGSEQKLVELRYGLHGEIPDGMLVRVSSIDADMASGHRLQAAFVAAMAAAMTPHARWRTMGMPMVPAA